MGGYAFPLPATGLVAAPVEPPGPTPQPEPEPQPQPEPGGIRPRPNDPQVKLWVGRYDSSNRNAAALKALGGPDAADQYRYSYDVDAAISAYEATGAKKYLDTAVGFADAVMESWKQRPDGYLGKTVTTSYHGSSWIGKEAALDDFYLARFLSRLARVMPVGTKRDELAAFLGRNVIDKWLSRGSSNVYRDRTHMQSHSGATAANLWAVTREAKYRQVADKVVANFRAQLRDHPVIGADAFWWNAVYGSFSRPGQDCDHGGALAVMVADTHDTMGHWTAGELGRFCMLFRFLIGKRKPDAIDGSGSNTGWFPEWTSLARYGRDTYDAAVEHSNTGQAQYRARMAVAAARLVTAIGSNSQEAAAAVAAGLRQYDREREARGKYRYSAGSG